MRVFESGQWWEHRFPFRHFRGSNVLPSDRLEKVRAAFNRQLEGDPNAGLQSEFVRGARNYDALMLAMTTELAPEFYPFFSEEWIRSLYEAFHLPYVPRLDGALHSNPLASRSGWIHTDFCSGWFDEAVASATDCLFPNRASCNYFNGTVHSSGVRPVEYARAATLIYYLCNDTWKSGDGGETALYASARQTTNTDTSLVPPLDNTALLFECSPHSYHRFISNPGAKRNSLILWIHRTVDRAESRWGKGALNRGAKN